MKVYELMQELSTMPAGAEVYIARNKIEDVVPLVNAELMEDEPQDVYLTGEYEAPKDAPAKPAKSPK